MNAPPPSWGQHTSVFQFRRPAFWVFSGFVVLSGFVTAVEQSIFFAAAPAGLILSWVLLALYLVPMAVIIYRLDLYEREPLSMAVAAFVWGATVATAAAGIANGGWGIVVLVAGGPEFASRWSAALTAPLTEEILKGAGIVLLFQIARQEFDGVMDGFVYGAMCGLGFTVVEDVYYFVAVFGGGVPDVLAGFFLRVVASGLYGHVLYSGLVGMGVAYAGTRRGPGRWFTAAGLFAIGVLFHFLWNSPLLDVFPAEPLSVFDVLVLIPVGLAVKGVPFLIFVGLLVRLALLREREWLLAAGAPEVGLGLRDGDLEALADPRRRRREARALARNGGRRAGRTLRKLHRAQMNLVMIRTRTDSEVHEALISQRRRCDDLRAVVDSYRRASDR